MLDPVPHHPYPPGMRVHHAAETDPRAHGEGSATVLAHVNLPHPQRGLVYQVDTGLETQHWPAGLTIPAGLWASAPPPAEVPEEPGPDENPHDAERG